MKKRVTNTDRYSMLIYWSPEDNSFLSSVFDLQGCMADGETYEEVLTNTKIAIKHWIKVAKKEGREIPQPEECK